MRSGRSIEAAPRRQNETLKSKSDIPKEPILSEISRCAHDPSGSFVRRLRIF